MKITIDLNDPNIENQVQKAIDEHVGRLTAQQLDSVMTKVLEVKVERVTEKMVEEIVGRKIDDAISQVLGMQDGYNRKQKLLGIIGEQARIMLTKANG